MGQTPSKPISLPPFFFHQPPPLRNRVRQWTFDQSRNWYALRQNGYSIKMDQIGIIEPSQNFSVSFLLNIKGKHPNWRNIFHFTTTGKDCCGMDDRVPAMWVYPGNQTNLHIRFTTNSNGNDGYDTQPLPLDSPQLITIVFNGNNFKYYLNGNKKFEGNYNGIHMRNPGTTLYIGDPWYPNDGNVHIKNFTIYAWSLSENEINNAYQNDFPVIPKQWIFNNSKEWYMVRPNSYSMRLSQMGFDNYDNISFSFLLKLTTRYSGWRNIFQVTNTGGDGGEGRVPAIFIYPNGRTNIHMRIQTDSGWNDGVDSQTELPLNQPLLITLIYNGNNFKYYLNGNKINDQNFNNIHKRNANSILYIANGWNPADDGLYIKNFTAYNRAINENDIRALLPSLEQEIQKQREIDEYNRRKNTPCIYQENQSKINEAKANNCNASINSCKLGDAYTTGIASVAAATAVNAPCKGDNPQIRQYSCQKVCPCVYGDLIPDETDKCTATCGNEGTVKGYRILTNGPNSCAKRKYGEILPCNRHTCPPPCMKSGSCPTRFDGFQTMEGFNIQDVQTNLSSSSDSPIDKVMTFEARVLQAVNLFNKEYDSYVTNCNKQDRLYLPDVPSNPDKKYCYEILRDLKSNSDDLVKYFNYYDNYLNSLPKDRDAKSFNNELDKVYPELVKYRSELDDKLKELYDIPGSKLLEQNYIYDSTMYYSVFFTVAATLTVYYAFTQLE